MGEQLDTGSTEETSTVTSSENKNGYVRYDKESVDEYKARINKTFVTDLKKLPADGKWRTEDQIHQETNGVTGGPDPYKFNVGPGDDELRTVTLAEGGTKVLSRRYAEALAEGGVELKSDSIGGVKYRLHQE